MIQIAPAILTTEAKVLKERMSTYLEVGFRLIDIDIQDETTASNPTVSVKKTIGVLQKLELPADLDLGFDLKIAKPEAAIAEILKFCKEKSLKPRIVVYFSNGNISLLKEYSKNAEMTLVVGVLGSKKMPKPAELIDFERVQLMTIDSEKQGAKLVPDLMFRADQLWGAGYEGKISIDGGVNLKSAELIRSYDNGEGILSHVSVGSYFQESAESELQIKMQKLQLALNI